METALVAVGLIEKLLPALKAAQAAYAAAKSGLSTTDQATLDARIAAADQQRHASLADAIKALDQASKT